MDPKHPSFLLLPALALAACVSSPTPNYDARFGLAVREARLAQTLNPGAVSTNPVMGMDGPAAREAAGRYRDSFKAPPPVVNVINIGGGVAGGGQ
jgi:hypothetical protein